MNGDLLKATKSSTIRRPSATGKLKLPKKQIEPILNTTLNKKPLLKQYSIAMQSKLQSLKQKITQKKQQAPQLKTQKQSSNIQKLLKPTKIAKPFQSKFEQKLILSQLEDFLSQHNLLVYKNTLIENHIDSLDILAEASQKELQQIGIPKGHALKLKVNINKYMMTSKRPQTGQKLQKHTQQQYRQSKTKDTDRNRSFISSTTAQNKRQQISLKNSQQTKSISYQQQSICIGTQQQDGLESITFIGKKQTQKKKSRFCLFCYQSIVRTQQQLQQQISEFCSSDCEQRYNQMFRLYQNNLIKAEQQFKSNQDQINQYHQQENIEQNNDQYQLPFGDDEFQEKYEDFDYQQFEELRRQLGGL